MNTYRTILEEALEAWEDARTGVIRELKNIPEKHFDFRPAKSVRSVREIAVHILEVALMMTGELTRKDTDFHRAPFPKLLDQYAKPAYRLKSRKQILTFLQTSLNDGMKKFLQVGELHMLQLIHRFDGKPGTRLAWLNHGIAQEMYHCGQLTTYARMLGLVPDLTKRIQAASANARQS